MQDVRSRHRSHQFASWTDARVAALEWHGESLCVSLHTSRRKGRQLAHRGPLGVLPHTFAEPGAVDASLVQQQYSMLQHKPASGAGCRRCSPRYIAAWVHARSEVYDAHCSVTCRSPLVVRASSGVAAYVGVKSAGGSPACPDQRQQYAWPQQHPTNTMCCWPLQAACSSLAAVRRAAFGSRRSSR